MELYCLSEGFLIMIRKYLLLASFVFGVGVISMQSCEAAKCKCIGLFLNGIVTCHNPSYCNKCCQAAGYQKKL